MNPLVSCRIPRTDLVVSRLAYGSAGLGGTWDMEPVTNDSIATAARAIHAAYESGITLFDHADVYALGKTEIVFGRVLRDSPGLRSKIVIQSKCGIQIKLPMSAPSPLTPHHYDFSYRHIIRSVEGSLERLGTDYLDILLLHRPDALVEPEEVAKAFGELQRSGKVRCFGVSNHTAPQIELLKRYIPQPLVVNQIALGLAHPQAMTDGIDANREDGKRLNPGYTGVAGLLDYCRLNDIQVQAYSPVRGLSGKDATIRPRMQQAVALLEELARQKHTSPCALALAWLLRHPAGIVPVIGTTNPRHIIENCGASNVSVSRQEWYALLVAATGGNPLKML